MPNNLCFIAFKRPKQTEETLGQLLLLDWDEIFVYIDGGRNLVENELCAQVHNLIKRLLDASGIDYKIIRQEKNLGCKNHVSYAISDFFEKQNGWVFEDDIYLKDTKAFDEVRIQIQNNPNAIHFGLHPFVENIYTKKTVFPTNGYSFIWGWYRNQPIDKKILMSPQFTWNNICLTIRERGFLGGILLCYSVKRTLAGLLDTWDTLYDYYNIVTKVQCFSLSRKNVIRNIGFHSEATHTIKETIAWDIAKWIPLPYKYKMVAFRILGKIC
jgi:hypothetical protein